MKFRNPTNEEVRKMQIIAGIIKEDDSYGMEETSEGIAKLDTSKFIEPEEMQATLSQIYHILSGNERDYTSIDHIGDVINCLRRYA